MANEYATKAEALQDFASVKEVKAAYPGRVKDVSGPDSFGYEYAIIGPDGRRILATETVWMEDEINKGGRKGAFAPMFRRAALPEIA